LPRFMEVALCGLGILLLSPLLLLVALLLKCCSPGPVLFRQQRLGYQGRPFELLKFRSMVHGERVPGLPLTTSGDRRVTRIGQFLRYTKLDELPQLWNVIRGDMALVGPRPEVPAYFRHHPRLFALALQQRPGITDACTLHLRREENLLALTEDPQRYYIETLLPRKLSASIRESWRRTFWRDLRVILATVIPWLAFLAPRADFRLLADLYTLPAAPAARARAGRGRQAAAAAAHAHDDVAGNKVEIGS